MNNKITKQRLKTFLVYDLVKMVAITTIVLLCVIIIFNWVGKRPNESQTFSVLIDNVEVITGDGEEAFYEKVTYGNNGNGRYGLSYEVLAGNVTQITPSSASPMETLVQTYIGTGDDDILIAGKTIATYYLGRGAAMEIEEEFIGLLTDFLCDDNGFYSSMQDDVEDINVQAVEEYFKKTRDKDTRYITAKQKEEGIKQEIERIKGYKTNADLFLKLLEVCPDILATEDYLTSYNLGGVTFNGTYALNLGALGSDFINVYKTKQTINDEEVDTTNGVYLLLGKRSVSDNDAMFETLAFILTLAEDYSNVLGG